MPSEFVRAVVVKIKNDPFLLSSGHTTLRSNKHTNKTRKTLQVLKALNTPSTSTRYSYGWKRWAQSKQGVPIMPACPLHNAFYLLELTEHATWKNVGCSVIDSALNKMYWAYKEASLESRTQQPTVVAVGKDAERKLSRPDLPKQPLKLENVVKVAQPYDTASTSLANDRFLLIQGVSKVPSDLFSSNVSLFIRRNKNQAYYFLPNSIISIISNQNTPPLFSMIFSKHLGIECGSSYSISRVTFFHAKRSGLFSSFIVLGARSLHVVSSMILHMFLMELWSGEIAGQPS